MPDQGSLPAKIVRHPIIVVTIPAYNEARHIAATIRSVKEQTWGDFAALISDNASTDRTAEICRREIAGDPRFRFVRHEQNRGAAPNFNYAYDAYPVVMVRAEVVPHDRNGIVVGTDRHELPLSNAARIDHGER